MSNNCYVLKNQNMLPLLQCLLDFGLPLTFLPDFANTQLGALLAVRFSFTSISFIPGVLYLAMIKCILHIKCKYKYNTNYVLP